MKRLAYLSVVRGVAGLILVAVSAGQLLADEKLLKHEADAASGTFAKSVRPFLELYCTDCHSQKDPARGVVLDRFHQESDALSGGDVWVRALQMLEARIMPPPDMPQPEPEETAAVVGWIENDFYKSQHGPGSSPPKAVIRRLNRQEYNNTIRDLLGVDSRPADDFPADEAGFGYDRMGSAQSVSTIHIEKYLEAAERVAQAAIVVPDAEQLDENKLPQSHRAILFCRPDGTEASRLDCAKRIIEKFAERAFRRPLRAGELDRLVQVFQTADGRGGCFERAIQVSVWAILASPQFLFLIEPDADRQSGPLDEFELASRLSYFLWSSMPDEELFREAREKTLRKNLRTQVSRMLADSKSEAFVESFAGQWLQLRKLNEVERDQEMFGMFDAELREAMSGETQRFFAHILRKNRSVLEFLDADYTFVNDRLARHYGMDGVQGNDFQQVSLTGRQRGGVLTQASVLTLTSNPNRTSPVKRGQWILEQLLGTPPPPPPPEIERLDESKQAMQSASLRERLEVHRTNAQCASCHNRMDPLGFALENYDAIGRWRTQDSGFPVEPAGKLIDGRAFADAKQLQELLRADSKKFCRCLIQNMMMYALGRGLEQYDMYSVEEIRRRLANDDYRFQTMLLGIIESDAFQSRGAAALADSSASSEDKVSTNSRGAR